MVAKVSAYLYVNVLSVMAWLQEGLYHNVTTYLILWRMCAPYTAASCQFNVACHYASSVTTRL